MHYEPICVTVILVVNSLFVKQTTLTGAGIFMDLYTLICTLPFIVLAIIGVGFLIMFHELGHYLFAKLFNVHTPSFSIGFGPRLIEKKIGDTVFALSAIPLGGYVEMAGSAEVGQGEQTHAHATDERSLASKPYWQKLLIIAGGILFNMIFAYSALAFLFYQGAPCLGSWCKDQPPIVASIRDNTPAQQAGLQPQDKLISVNNTPVSSIAQVSDAIKVSTDNQAKLTVWRAGTEHTVTAQLEKTKTGPRLSGIFWHAPSLPFTQAFSQAWSAMWGMTSEIFGALKGITKNRDGLGGPLALIAQVTECAGMGFKIFLFMLAFISVNLAVFNVIPLPIFDGGQALFFTIEAIAGRALPDETRYKIHYATWVIVMGLIIYLTYKDFTKLLGF